MSIHPASFKDPAGFVFQDKGIFYRQINPAGISDYNHLMGSGLFQELVEKKLLIGHEEIHPETHPTKTRILKPRQLARVSYAYEWSLDQLRDAGLLTLKVMRISLEKGMILKDASAYNIQFEGAEPVFIDTLSFTAYDPEKPWIAYRQFCQHFLFPILLERYTGWNARELLRVHPDGIPVSTTAQLLPFRCRFNPAIALHVFLQNKMAQAPQKQNSAPPKFSRTKLTHLLAHLESMLEKKKDNKKSVWSNYYSETILSDAYLKTKSEMVEKILSAYPTGNLLDMGANDGHFSKLAAAKGWSVVATDFDDLCINRLYLETKKSKADILSLHIDLTNPSPAQGFAHTERDAFTTRFRSDLVMALALIHHLVITNNIPFARLAAYLHQLAPELLIEFVPRDDEKAAILLARKEHRHPDYTEEQFEKEFGEFFILKGKQTIPGSRRTLYQFSAR